MPFFSEQNISQWHSVIRESKSDVAQNILLILDSHHCIFSSRLGQLLGHKGKFLDGLTCHVPPRSEWPTLMDLQTWMSIF
jgi:hypothetical protein